MKIGHAIAILIAALGVSFLALRSRTPSPRPGMVFVRGGEFTMGTDSEQSFANERPARRVRVAAFWIDEHEVTNAQFARFVEATGHVTTAEVAPKLEDIMAQVPPGTPPPDPALLVPGALVFQPSAGPVALNPPVWWHWTPGASWRRPEGPDSTIAGREDHPVVCVSWDDAVAYAGWAGKRLPTEAEWEVAARGGLEKKRYSWGDEAPTDERPACNIWQGDFPYRNTLVDRFMRTAPVKSFAPNGYGLHDMAGNVWEWCSDRYLDPAEPYTPKRIMKGGSFLCHVTYCESYRPSARRGTSPDTGMSHVGFRCVAN